MSQFRYAAFLSLGITLSGGAALAQVANAPPQNGGSCSLLPDGSVKTSHTFTPADGVEIFVAVEGSSENFKGASVLLVPGSQPSFVFVDSAYLNPAYNLSDPTRDIDASAAVLGEKAIKRCLATFIPS